MPKDMRGMGFRDLTDFNTAMLTKTSWRLQNESDSVWSQIMKGLYYPRGSPMNAKKGVRPSWAWANILTGCDMLQEHGIWRVRKGNRIRSFKDAWIPGINGNRIQSDEGTMVDENVAVAQLIEHGRKNWNLDKIQHAITNEDRWDVSFIYLSHS